MKIRANLLWLAAIGIGGLVMFAALALAVLSRVEINGAAYRQIALSKDLVSDYVPPSQSLLEIARICGSMALRQNPAEIEHDISLLEAAQKRLEEEYADYMRRVPEGKLKELMRGTAYQTARRYIQIAKREFIPLVKRGELKRARDLLVTEMNPLYEQHSKAVDQIVHLANQEAAEGESRVAQLVRFSTGLMIGGGLAILVAVGVLSSAIARGISKQTSELVRSEERFRTIFRLSPNPMAIVKPGGGIVDMNDAGLRKFGVTLNEAVDRTADDLGISLEPAAKLREEAQKAEYRLHNRETRYRNRSGQELTLLLSTELIHIAGGPHLVVMGLDISEQKRQEELKRMLSSAVTTASDAIIITDNDLNPTPTVLYANPAFTRLTGYSSEEVVGRRTSDTFGARVDAKSTEEIRQALLAGNAFHGEVTNYSKNGRMLVVELDIVPVRDDAGKLSHFVAVRRDISRRKAEEFNRQRLLHLVFEAQTEERRRISRELHDHAGQLLTSMLLRLNVLQETTPDQAVKHAVEEISAVASNTLEDISRLARGLHPAVLEDLGLTQALQRTVEEFSFGGISATFDVTGDTERLPRHVEREIYQIIKEALTNVQKHSRADRVGVYLEKRDRSVVAIVQDNGVGFDTSAPPTGEPHLGIVGMSERTTLLGGSLLVTSAVGQGTTVTLTVPLKPAEEAARYEHV